LRNLKLIFLAIFGGAIITLISASYQLKYQAFDLPLMTVYGFPIPWLVATGNSHFILWDSLAVDLAFWSVISAALIFICRRYFARYKRDDKRAKMEA